MSYTRSFWETWVQEQLFFFFVKDRPGKDMAGGSQPGGASALTALIRA